MFVNHYSTLRTVFSIDIRVMLFIIAMILQSDDVVLFSLHRKDISEFRCFCFVKVTQLLISWLNWDVNPKTLYQ